MLTEDGIAFHDRAKRILRDVDDAADEISERRGVVAGLLRISATQRVVLARGEIALRFQRYVVPLLPGRDALGVFRLDYCEAGAAKEDA